MGKIIVRVSAVCGALPLEGAAVYINGELCGQSGKNGYTEVIEANGDSCVVGVTAKGYEKYLSDRVRLYKNATVVWSAMLEGQTRSKNQEKA